MQSEYEEKALVRTMRLSLRVFGYIMGLDTWAKKIPKTKVMGIASRCDDGMHVVLGDYDRIDISVVISDVSNLIKRFGLSHFYILKSSPDCYHAICISKVTRGELSEILQYSHFDEKAKQAPFSFFYREAVLRFSKKGEKKYPIFECEIKSPFFKREASRSHLEFLKKYYGILITDETKYKLDNGNSLPVIYYTTGMK